MSCIVYFRQKNVFRLSKSFDCFMISCKNICETIKGPGREKEKEEDVRRREPK